MKKTITLFLAASVVFFAGCSSFKNDVNAEGSTYKHDSGHADRNGGHGDRSGAGRGSEQGRGI